MIERIAAAIYKAREENIERPLRDKTTLEAMAKAAIEAMRDPTSEMALAGDRQQTPGDSR